MIVAQALKTGSTRCLMEASDGQSIDELLGVRDDRLLYVAHAGNDQTKRAVWELPVDGGSPKINTPIEGVRASLLSDDTVLSVSVGPPGDPGQLLIEELTGPT